MVRGRVQGVGFRWFVVREAHRLQVSGFVRNLPDGDVEVCAWGAQAALQSLELALGRGPGGARVDHVDKSEIPHDIKRFNSFEIQ